MDKHGYVNVAELLALRRFQALSVTLAEIQDIVANNDKQRFSLIPSSNPATSPSKASTSENSSAYLIRANQGHSLTISSEDLLKPVLPTDPDCPQQVVHGTNAAAWEGIYRSGGLKKMGRQHIHFSTGIPDYHNKTPSSNSNTNNAAPKSSPKAESDVADELEVVGEDGTKKSTSKVDAGQEAVISGMRKSATIMIWVDLARSAEQGGVKWWRSDNGVILTEGDHEGMVKMEWVDRVERRGTGEILWRRTEK